MNNRNGVRALKVNILTASPSAAHALEAMRGRAQHRERMAFARAMTSRTKSDSMLSMLADVAVNSCKAFA